MRIVMLSVIALSVVLAGCDLPNGDVEPEAAPTQTPTECAEVSATEGAPAPAVVQRMTTIMRGLVCARRGRLHAAAAQLARQTGGGFPVEVYEHRLAPRRRLPAGLVADRAVEAGPAGRGADVDQERRLHAPLRRLRQPLEQPVGGDV